MVKILIGVGVFGGLLALWRWIGTRSTFVRNATGL